MRLLAAIQLTNVGDYILFDFTTKETIMSEPKEAISATELQALCPTAETTKQAEHLMGLGVRWSVIRDLLGAGFSWDQIVKLLLEYGLPMLIEFLKEILAGTRTVDDILAADPPTMRAAFAVPKK